MPSGAEWEGSTASTKVSVPMNIIIIMSRSARPARSHSYSNSACRFFAARSVSNRSSHAEWGRVGGRGRENRPLSRSKVSMRSPDLAGGHGREKRPLQGVQILQEGTSERTDRCHARRCPDLVSSSGTRTIVSSLRVRGLFAGPVIFAGSRFAPAAPRCDDGVVRGQKEVTWQN